jgi:antitoxin HigA-1
MREEFPAEPDKMTRSPTHPGLFFALDILPEFRAQGRTVSEIARLLGVTRQTLHRVMRGQSAVTADMAVRLGKLCGNGPDLWLAMQARHDAWQAKRRLGEDLKSIPTLGDESVVDVGGRERRQIGSAGGGMNLRRRGRASRSGRRGRREL